MASHISDPNVPELTIHRGDANGPAAQLYIDALNAFLETLPDFANLKGPRMGGEGSPRPHTLPAGSVLLYASHSAQSPATSDPGVSEDNTLGALCLMPLISGTPSFHGLPESIDKAAEIKRMFVFPSARGKGVAMELVHEAERYALETMGMKLLVVETLWLLQGAQGFYRKAGFEERGVWGGYVESDSVCFEKWL